MVERTMARTASAGNRTRVVYLGRRQGHALGETALLRRPRRKADSRGAGGGAQGKRVRRDRRRYCRRTGASAVFGHPRRARDGGKWRGYLRAHVQNARSREGGRLSKIERTPARSGRRGFYRAREGPGIRDGSRVHASRITERSEVNCR